MPCTIWFVGDTTHVLHVAQSAEEIVLQIRDSDGAPLGLDDTQGVRVHVVPSAIAYFRDQGTPAAR